MAQPAKSGEAEQLYVTHCTRADSVGGQEGFGVRAGSTSDPALLRFAQELPAYELPLEMWSLNPTARQAPRRLARAELPDGRVALAHSAYLPRDTRGREGSYFTHILFYERLSPLEALRAWAAPEWQTDYAPGAPKELPPFVGLPSGRPIHDAALTAFLDPSAGPATDQDLATSVLPARAAAAGARRRHWLRLALVAWLRALAAPEDGRSRVFVRAEPGVLALLLYAVARLLPEPLVAGLTFSTYESGLRERRGARVIGTYTGSEQRGLDEDYALRHGHALDLFRDPADAGEPAPAVEQLVALAAGGDWAAVDEVHALWARGAPPSAETLAEAALLQPAYRRARAAPPALPDLATLARSALGRELLAELTPPVWPLVWRTCLEDDRTRSDFAPLLLQRREELEDNFARALTAGGEPPWPKHWGLLRNILPAAEAAACYRRGLTAARGEAGLGQLPLAARLALLCEWQAVEPGRPLLPEEDADLLQTAGGAELRELLDKGLPAGWVGQALCRALAEPGRANEVKALLSQKAAGRVRGLCAALAALDGPRGGDLLARLLLQRQSESIETFALLQANGLALAPAVLEGVLEQARAARGEWLRHWLDGDHLAKLGQALQPGSDLLRRIWARYVRVIDEDYLLGDRKQAALVKRLQRTRVRLGERTPREAVEALDDWSRLHEQLHDPPPPSPRQAAAVEAAWRRRQLADPAALLKKAFGGALAGPEPAGDECLRQLVHSAAGFLGPDLVALVGPLLDLVESCPTPLRAAYQRFFLRCAPPGTRPGLVETYRDRLDVAPDELEELLAEAGRRRWWRWGVGLLAALAAGGFGGYLIRVVFLPR